ncbi:hypothetical protein M427DRAFT_72922 [Gonapodya prolifera JEL478]|uniref:Lytic polysaccharide monooxygenase n=1 Tax=Gonapodya prolifera (strain JEL478) TaxID=1344416 RepID=A0A139A4Z7_GONPJ|nr:hypothetical protein M427DRAFT_72922 [Gonapodya prolifera JEL478]|eukprot:KXS11463.1 hypothetical protein M427DRAFT_72922 [Gonapodya prolifera JEL478]
MPRSTRSTSFALSLALAAVMCLSRGSDAFTNGSLIPSYICDVFDQANGAPQSLGQVVPYLQEDDGMAAIAGYHHHFMAPYAALDLCTASICNGTEVTQTTTFQVSVKNTSQVLVGLIVWIQDMPAANMPRHIGTIISPGKNMMLYPWRGCGKMGSTIVQSAPLNDGNPTPQMSSPFTWTLGSDGIAGTMVEVRGVCITQGPTGGKSQGGYGKFAIQVPVTKALQNTFWGFASW